VQEYVVETYLGRGSTDEFRDAVARARALSDVRWVRSAFVDDDELCLHWFVAPSQQAVRDAVERAQIGCDRVVTAETIEEEGR
jgi:flavin-binding protein dodecin